MIKFFRKIRMQMLSESRIGRYFFYALGEIILVVIGILIALQINDWNDNRKNELLVDTYRSNLIENLVRDSANIAMNISRIKEEPSELREFEKRAATSVSPLDTIAYIARYDYQFLISGLFDYETDTYEVLLSTGDIGLFSDGVVKELIALKNLQDFALFSQNQTFETYRTAMSRYARTYPFTFRNNLIREGTVAADQIWNDISMRDHATQFNALIIAKGDAYRLCDIYLTKVYDKTVEVLKELRRSS